MNATRTLIFAGVAAAWLSGLSFAADTRNQGYLVDSNGNVVTSATTGECWRDSDWNQARTAEPCGPVKKPVAAVPAPRAPVVAAAPPPPPAATPQPAPAKPLPTKISFSADALFAFDKSVLKPEGRAMLDDLARQLNGATYSTIGATGHTDRFGSNEYNQKLSERRANAVKDYLVSRNVPAGSISAEGKGETQPVTKAGDCPGAKSAKVIACLQPDRRVDVEVNGTQASATGSR
jgi:OOP family OmpA-OmpF porin